MGRLTILGVGFAAATTIAVAGGIAFADDHHTRPATAVAVAHEDSAGRHHDDTAVAASTRISAAQADRIARTAVPGARILSTEFRGTRRTPTWEVKLTAKGVQRELLIDARTGKIIKNEVRHASRGHRDDHPGRDDHRGGR
ncbi:PepSY domain-containing protein [Actinoallomurus rhizosphaericola]|uniref:PepSY domain-containing protein n=1 Tax=Actinoallomurus rhizosphaericola TaxID=2952536 RepID=UPI0020901108|nr:PepSY domain-containing protein [Actinoallomurus rhizosphaericola]MCO5994298.1 PepSY domain-containing protein [Actinoallomurus rhizosphaericola]